MTGRSPANAVALAAGASCAGRPAARRGAVAAGLGVALLLAGAAGTAEPAQSGAAAAAGAAGVAGTLAAAIAPPSYRVPFTLSVEGVTTNLAVISTSLLPGETLTVRTAADRAEASAGTLERLPAGEGEGWRWVAPASSGIVTLHFSEGEASARLNAFVLTPWANGAQEELNGFRIGAYSPTPLRGLATYVAPRGFIAVGEEHADLHVSPHFTLGQFFCKQAPGELDTRYLLVRTALLVKLERLREEVSVTHPIETLTVMSGFRTPWYNAAIGNRTTSSRHLYGGAADVFVDGDGDGVMDDLNGDGRVDRTDATWLADLAERIADAGDPQWPSGGVGVYDANSAHGPFVHVDARGFRARWGR